MERKWKGEKDKNKITKRGGGRRRRRWMSPSQRRISAPRSLDRDVSLEDFRTSKVLGKFFARPAGSLSFL